MKIFLKRQKGKTLEINKIFSFWHADQIILRRRRNGIQWVHHFNKLLNKITLMKIIIKKK